MFVEDDHAQGIHCDQDMFNFGKKRIHEVKIAIIGPAGAGKTTIARAFHDHRDFDNALTNTASNSTHNHLLRYNKTLGADLFKKRISVETLLSDVVPLSARPREGNPALRERDDVNITIWDTAGFERFDANGIPCSLILSGCDVVITCFSCDDSEGIDKAETLLSHLEKSGKLGPHCVHLILCTKADVVIRPHELIRRTTVLLNARNDNGGSFEGSKPHVHDASLFQELISKELFRLDKFEELSRREKSINSEVGRLKENELLLACTSSFCSDALCTANPIFCILYTVFFHLTLKTNFTKYDPCLQPFRTAQLYERRKTHSQQQEKKKGLTLNSNETSPEHTSLEKTVCC